MRKRLTPAVIRLAFIAAVLGTFFALTSPALAAPPVLVSASHVDRHPAATWTLPPGGQGAGRRGRDQPRHEPDEARHRSLDRGYRPQTAPATLSHLDARPGRCGLPTGRESRSRARKESSRRASTSSTLPGAPSRTSGSGLGRGGLPTANSWPSGEPPTASGSMSRSSARGKPRSCSRANAGSVIPSGRPRATG
jgi:hypothetical protein